MQDAGRGPTCCWNSYFFFLLLLLQSKHKALFGAGSLSNGCLAKLQALYNQIKQTVRTGLQGEKKWSTIGQKDLKWRKGEMFEDYEEMRGQRVRGRRVIANVSRS